MNLLALDTSTEACSVALRAGDALFVRRHHGAREQTAHILPMVQAVLDEAGLTLPELAAIACAHGPGAFTGVRVAVSVAQGLAFGAGIPALGISTLAALAQQAVRVAGAQQVLPVLDARMGELYAGAYQCGADGLVDALTPDRLLRPEEFAGGIPAGRRWTAIGSGWPLLTADLPGAELIGSPIIAEPDAEDVLALAVRALARGEAVAPEQLLPVYLRDTVAWKKLAEQGKG